MGNIEDMTVAELLGSYAQILAELRRREVRRLYLNGSNVHMTPALLAEPGVVDITEQVQHAAELM